MEMYCVTFAFERVSTDTSLFYTFLDWRPNLVRLEYSCDLARKFRGVFCCQLLLENVRILSSLSKHVEINRDLLIIA